MTLNRRDFVKGVAAVPILSASSISVEASRELVNDVHTGLNPTWVDRVVRPTSIIEIQNLIHECHRQNKVLSVSGSRHAAGASSSPRDRRCLICVASIASWAWTLLRE